MDNAIAAMQAPQARYAALADQVGVPWYFVAVVHQREGSGNFSQSVRDGHRLPAGLSWEDDALAVMQEQCGGWHNWSLPGLLYRLEAYNGFGYRQYQINSPYLWSFATCYTRGKFVADGRFDSDQVDAQPGTAVILHRMVARGLITIPGAAVSPAAPAPKTPAAPAAAPPSGSTYVVQPGDTLSKIAAAYDLSWQEIWEANKDCSRSGYHSPRAGTPHSGCRPEWCTREDAPRTFTPDHGLYRQARRHLAADCPRPRSLPGPPARAQSQPDSGRHAAAGAGAGHCGTGAKRRPGTQCRAGC